MLHVPLHISPRLLCIGILANYDGQAAPTAFGGVPNLNPVFRTIYRDMLNFIASLGGNCKTEAS